MAHEMQPTDGRQEQQSSLPAHSQTEHLGLRLAYFGYTAIPSAILLDIMTQGQIGESAAVAAFLGGAACYWAPHLHKAITPGLRAAGQVWDYLNRNNSGKTKHRLMDKQWWLTGEASIQYAEEETQIENEPEAGQLETGVPENAPDPSPANEPEKPVPHPSLPPPFAIKRMKLA